MKRLGEKTKKSMEAVWNKSTNKKNNNLKIPENLVIEKQPAFVLESKENRGPNWGPVGKKRSFCETLES